MATTEVSFREFVELMLARLAEADRDHPGTWVDMFPLAEQLRQNVPDDWVFEAREVLENRSLVSPLKVLGRTAPARLTGEGRLFVEDGGSTGIIEEYRQAPSHFVIVSGSGHNVAVGNQGDVTQTSLERNVPGEAWTLLDEIEQSLEQAGLSDRDRREALEDVRTARLQLERPQPNKSAAIALLDPLAKIASVGNFVTRLVGLLG
jgi:hypothetical protein